MGSAVAVKEEEPEDLSLRRRHAATQTEGAGHGLEAFTPEQVKGLLELVKKLTGVPTMPNMPNMPNMTNMPTMPTMPNLPPQPAAPSLPSLPPPFSPCTPRNPSPFKEEPPAVPHVTSPSPSPSPSPAASRCGWISLEPEKPSPSLFHPRPSPSLPPRPAPSPSRKTEALTPLLPQPPPLVRAGVRGPLPLPALQRLGDRRPSTERYLRPPPDLARVQRLWHLPPGEGREEEAEEGGWRETSPSTLSETDSEERRAGRLCRDQRIAQGMAIPFTVDEIIRTPMEEFNDMLSRHQLSEEQINLCRDIRRRGKNKIAAQNCRKRKLEQICLLEQDLGEARGRKETLVRERVELLRVRREWQERLERLEEGILGGLGEQGSVLRLGPGNQVVLEATS